MMFKNLKLNALISVFSLFCSHCLLANICQNTAIFVEGKYDHCKIELDGKTFLETKNISDEESCKIYCNEKQALTPEKLTEVLSGLTHMAAEAKMAPSSCGIEEKSARCSAKGSNHFLGFEEVFRSIENASNEELCDRSKEGKTKLREKVLGLMREALAYYKEQPIDHSKREVSDKKLAADPALFHQEMKKMWVEAGEEAKRRGPSDNSYYTTQAHFDIQYPRFEKNDLIILPDFEQANRSYYNYSSFKKYLPAGILPVVLKKASKDELAQTVEHPLRPRNIDGAQAFYEHDIGHSSFLAEAFKQFNLADQSKCLAFMKCIESTEYSGKQSLKKEIYNLFHEHRSSVAPNSSNSHTILQSTSLIEGALEVLLSGKSFSLSSFLGEGIEKRKACGSIKKLLSEHQEYKKLSNFRKMFTAKGHSFAKGIFTKKVQDVLSDPKKEVYFESFVLGMKLDLDENTSGFLQKLDLKCKADMKESDYLADPKDKALKDQFSAVLAKGFAQQIEDNVVKQLKNYDIVLKNLKQNPDCRKAHVYAF